MTSTSSDRGSATSSRRTSASWRWLAAALVLGAVVVVADEVVLWSGQPTGHASAAEVSRWYHAEAARVLVGDLLWAAACLALGTAFWRVSGGLGGRVGRALRIVGVVAATVVATAAGLAATLALVDTPDATSLWRTEGQVYRAGAVLVALTLLLLAWGAREGRPVLAVAAVVVGLTLVVPATTLVGLAGSFVLLAGASG